MRAGGSARAGTVAAAAAFFLWGLFPLYWKMLAAVPALEVVAHRTAWGFVAVAAWVTWRRHWPDARAVASSPQTVVRLGGSAVLIALNWLLYIWAVAHDHVVEASLGYFINPLVNVLLGVLVLRERLSRAQWLAVALAAAGVAVLTLRHGRLPWIALALAVTFGLYGLARKTVGADAVVGLLWETGLLAPLAAGWLSFLGARGSGAFGAAHPGASTLLALGGAVTAVPLVLFALGARSLPLSTLGFLQYLSPSIQFLLAVLVFREPFTAAHAATFACIWAALAVLTWELRRKLRHERAASAFAGLLVAALLSGGARSSCESLEPRPHVAVRGIYGGVPQEVLDSGRSLAGFGIDAVWMGSGSFTPERVALLRAQKVGVFAEFNTLHVAEYLKDHPDAAPIGPDGRVSPPPDGWQGICPSHEAYRRSRMDAFRQLLREFEVDGVWLDYHHAHASWEQAVPNMPDTCFCDRCLGRFQKETGVTLKDASTAESARLLLSTHRQRWIRWRCDLLTDWVREFREIRDATRPAALLGTFHNPWSDEDHGGARLAKLAIDLRAQAAHVDVFSPMPYHARFGHAAQPEWISRQVAWLGRHLGIEGKTGERHRIWPIVQVSDWGETVPLEQVPAVLDHGSRRPATGVMVFAWSGLRKQPDKIETIGRAFRRMRRPE